MCGIVGYIGRKRAKTVLIEGLKRLEYRGYDSAGLAAVVDGHLAVCKCPGRISNLESMLAEHAEFNEARIGIAHTRWATHGAPNEVNAHPHLSDDKQIALVHNGIIENYWPLKQLLEAKGHTFASQTDTEVLANLIAEFYRTAGSLELAVQQALREVTGTYGIAVLSLREPERLVVGARAARLSLAWGRTNTSWPPMPRPSSSTRPT